MFKAIGNYFKAPPILPVSEDKAIIDKKYKRYRIDVFSASFIGYTVFHLTKKNISPALPAIQEEFHYSNLQLGLLATALYFTYAFGKFINGMIADKADAKKFMTAALLISAISNIILGFSPEIVNVITSVFPNLEYIDTIGMPLLLFIMAFCWGINGWFQSMGFPGIAKALAFWFSNTERGTKWALWSTSHQFGTMLGALLAGWCIVHFGWRAAFIIPGVINILMSVFTYMTMHDKPQTMGLPEVEEYREGVKPSPEEADEEAHMSYFDILKKYIFFNKTIWILALAYVFVYICRYGTEDWIIKFLVDRGDSMELATKKFGSLAFFGIWGAISAGFLSDKLFKGKRTPVNLIFLAGCAASIFIIMNNQFSGSLRNIVDVICLAGMGFFVAGPQMLVGGICAVESGSKKVASAATGFCGLSGYIGAMLSGAGTGFFIDLHGWNGAFWFWIASAICCMLILSTLIRKGV